MLFRYNKNVLLRHYELCIVASLLLVNEELCFDALCINMIFLPPRQVGIEDLLRCVPSTRQEGIV